MTAYPSGTEVNNSASRQQLIPWMKALQAAAEEAARSVILSDTGLNEQRRFAIGFAGENPDKPDYVNIALEQVFDIVHIQNVTASQMN